MCVDATFDMRHRRTHWTGGFEYNGLTMILSCESTLAFSSLSAQTNETAPTRSP